MAKNTIIDGIAASEHLDSSGESLSIDGMDISSLGGPDSILNWEHGAKEKPSQVVGKVTFAKKIRKKEDAKTRREKYFWNKSKKPFVYIKAELFDGLGHSGAQDVAAMLKYKNKDKGEDSRLVVGFSIEGGKMDKKGMNVTKSIARDVAITVKPCNKMCDAEILENTKDDKDFLYKNQSFDCEILEKGEVYVKLNADKYRDKILNDIKKGETGRIVNGKALNPGTNQKEDKKRANDAKKKATKISSNKIKKIGWKTNNNMRKALIAGVMGGAPSGLTGMAAMATEDLLGSKKKRKKGEITKNEEIPPNFEEVHPNEFHEHVTNFRNSSELASSNIHPYESDDYGQMKTFMSPDRKSGYAIKNGNELVSVHSSERGRGNHIVRHAVKNGAKKLDAYDIKGKLPSLYSKHGFKETGRYKFDPTFADPNNKTLHAHQPDFVEMRIPESIIKKNQPTMGFKELGIENNPNMQVKTVDPSKSFKTKAGREVSSAELEGMKVGNKYLQGAKEATGVSDLGELPDVNREYVEDTQEIMGEPLPLDTASGVNVSIPEVGVNEAMDFSGPGQSKKEMAITKGKGNFPSTRQHEGLHRTFSEVSQKHSPEHSKNLISYIMENFFSPENIDSVSDFVNTRYDSDSPHLKEEHLTHIIDLITNVDKRNSHEALVQNGKIRDIDYKQIKRGWQDAVKFTKTLDEAGLNKINDLYNNQNKKNKSKKVKVQRYDSKGNEIAE